MCVAGVPLGTVAVLGSCVSSEMGGRVPYGQGTSLAVDSASQDSYTAQPAKTIQRSFDRNLPELQKSAVWLCFPKCGMEINNATCPGCSRDGVS